MKRALFLSAIFCLLSSSAALAADSQGKDFNLYDFGPNATAILKLHDNGDGTKSPSVYVVNPSSGGSSSAERTPTIVAHTTSGTVSAGCRSLLFIASSDFAGTVLTNFPMLAESGLQVPIPAGDTIGAVAYTVTAGTLYSLEVR